MRGSFTKCILLRDHIPQAPRILGYLQQKFTKMKFQFSLRKNLYKLPHLVIFSVPHKCLQKWNFLFNRGACGLLLPTSFYYTFILFITSIDDHFLSCLTIAETAFACSLSSPQSCSGEHSQSFLTLASLTARSASPNFLWKIHDSFTRLKLYTFCCPLHPYTLPTTLEDLPRRWGLIILPASYSNGGGWPLFWN